MVEKVLVIMLPSPFASWPWFGLVSGHFSALLDKNLLLDLPPAVGRGSLHGTSTETLHLRTSNVKYQFSRSVFLSGNCPRKQLEIVWTSHRPSRGEIELCLKYDTRTTSMLCDDFLIITCCNDSSRAQLIPRSLRSTFVYV